MRMAHVAAVPTTRIPTMSAATTRVAAGAAARAIAGFALACAAWCPPARVVWCMAGAAVCNAAGSGWHAAARGAEPAAPSPEDRVAREQRVLAFVAEHQPELADVLAHLGKRKPAEYEAAIADLHRSVQALSTSRSKDERLHGIELRAWQARTRIDLLVARWLAGGKKDRARLEPALREAVTAELDVRAEHLAYRKERSAAWYDRQIVRLRDRRDELVAARLSAVLSPDEKKPKPSAATPDTPTP